MDGLLEKLLKGLVPGATLAGPYIKGSLMPPTRFQPPDRLMGATAFAREDGVRGPLNMV